MFRSIGGSIQFTNFSSISWSIQFTKCYSQRSTKFGSIGWSIRWSIELTKCCSKRFTKQSTNLGSICWSIEITIQQPNFVPIGNSFFCTNIVNSISCSIRFTQ